MLSLLTKIREISGKKVKNLRGKNIIPAVLYGPKIKNINLEIDSKVFDKVFKEVGESSLLKLEIEAYSPQKGDGSSQARLENGGKSRKEFAVLVHEIQRDPLTEKPTHIDFYLPPEEKEIIIKVPILTEGEAPAVKELGGTLVKDIHEIEIKGLIQNLPKEIKINISNLKTFNDHIKVMDLILPPSVKILRNEEEIIVSVTPPEKVEEELAKPVAAPVGEPRQRREEKVEEVKVVEKEKKEGETGEAESGKPEKPAK